MTRCPKIASVATLIVLLGQALWAAPPVPRTPSADGFNESAAEVQATVDDRTADVQDQINASAGLGRAYHPPSRLYQVNPTLILPHRAAIDGGGDMQTVYRVFDGTPASASALFTSQNYAANALANRQWMGEAGDSGMTNGMKLRNLYVHGGGYSTNNWFDNALVPHNDPYILGGVKLWTAGSVVEDSRFFRGQGTAIHIDRGEGATFSGIKHPADAEVNKIRNVKIGFWFRGVWCEPSDQLLENIDVESCRDEGIVIEGGGSKGFALHPWNCLTDCVGWAGTLTTRTDDETGTITMSAGHGIATGRKVRLAWTGSGNRWNVTVGTVSGNTVPIGADNAGDGDVLPASSTAVTVFDENMGIGLRTGLCNGTSGMQQIDKLNLDNDRIGWTNYSAGTQCGEIFTQECVARSVNLVAYASIEKVTVTNLDEGCVVIYVGKDADYSSVQQADISFGSDDGGFTGDTCKAFVNLADGFNYRSTRFWGNQSNGPVAVSGRLSSDEGGSVAPNGQTIYMSVDGSDVGLNLRGIGAGNTIMVTHHGSTPASGGCPVPISFETGIEPLANDFGNLVQSMDLNTGIVTTY